MRVHVSIRPAICRSGALIRKGKLSGFLIIEALIALAGTVVFACIIMTLRIQLASWHMHAQDYLQASNIADRVFERIMLKQTIPDSVGKFHIKKIMQDDTKIPYTHIWVKVQWISANNQEKEINIFGGMVHEA